MLATPGDVTLPPIFLIGPPRSGTTLLYQLLTHAYEFSYIANVARVFPDSPIAASRLFRRWILASRTDFRSEHGRTAGWWGPHEGGFLWNRWFPEDVLDVTETTLTPEAKQACRQLIAGIERALGRRFVNKNVKHSVRMRALDDLFPGCIFLRMSREPIATVSSILRARESDGLAEGEWWSVRPRDYEQLRNLPVMERVCGQFVGVEQDIDTDALHLGPHRVMCVEYEQLCARPAAVLQEIGNFLAPSGGMPPVKSRIPDAFPRSPGASLSAASRDAIRSSLERWSDRSSAAERTDR